MNGLFFIINPSAGHGRGMKVWNKVKRELERKKVLYRSFYTEYPGHAEILARQVATIQNYHLKTIVGVGGDGTIHEIVNGLSSFQQIQIGFLSAGSGNDFARGFQLPTHPIKAIRLIIQRVNKPVTQYDLGEFRLGGKNSGQYFINHLGIGLQADVQKEVENIPIKKLLAMLKMEYVTFIIAFFKVLLEYQPSSLEVCVNGEFTTYNNVWFITISNGPNYHGKIKVTSNANATNGELNVTIVHSLNRFQLFMVMFSNMTGKHLKEVINKIACESISITSNQSLLIHADGEIVGETPVSISIRKSRVALIK
jgi:YegS/Rv2252/BmrU family lipid kinase